MATNGKVVIDEIILDDDEEDDEKMEDSNDSSDLKEHFNSSSNGFQIEQGRADNGFHHDNDDDEEMDYDQIAHVNQPVDFIFAVEDDDGVETDIGTQSKIFSSEFNENKSHNHESSVKKTTQFKSSQQQTPTTDLDQPVRTRSALRQQSNPQNGHSVITSLLNSTPTTVTSNIQRDKRKIGASETAPGITPGKQLRSSVRETRSVQNKPTQPIPSGPKNTNKKATNNTPINSNTSTQSTPSEIKSANKKLTTINNNPTVNGGTTGVTKSGKKTVNLNKGTTVTPNNNSSVNQTSVTTNGKQNGISTNGTIKTIKNLKGPTDTPASVGTITVPKKRTRSYWTGKEHLKQLGPEAPYVMVERLSLFLSGQTEYKGHDCLNTVCPAKPTFKKGKPPLPPPRIQPMGGNHSSAITNGATDKPTSPSIPPVRPQIGQIIRFQFWQTPLGNNVPAKSSYQKAKIIGYDDEFDLYEIQLFHYDHPFIITKDKSKNQRVTTNTMVIDWDSLADPSIISRVD